MIDDFSKSFLPDHTFRINLTYYRSFATFVKSDKDIIDNEILSEIRLLKTILIIYLLAFN